MFAPMQKFLEICSVALGFDIKRAVAFVAGESDQAQIRGLLHCFKPKIDPLNMSVNSDFEKFSRHFILRIQLAKLQLAFDLRID